MIKTIKHQNVGIEVVAAKLLTGYASVKKKITDTDSFVKLHQTFDADFVAHITAWQSGKGIASDGEIGPDTWKKIAEKAPTCSTSKNRISGPTLAIQLLLDSNIACDGIYGPRTKAAVVVFQKAKKLSADGICGPKTWNALLVGAQVASAPTAPASGVFKQPVDYKQGDSRWGKKMYSNHNDKNQTMASSGCGPTATADVVATLRDRDKTPYDLAQLAMKWGDRTYNSGTAWTFMIPHIMEHFGFSQAVQTKNLDALKACLDAGGYVVCSMGPGYWTSGGHFICAWKYDSTYIYANDPASSSRKKQKITEFTKERKQYFCFYPRFVDDEVKEPEPQKTAEPVNQARGTEIVDVARYQGDIDWAKLAPNLAFAIIKASGLYKNGADTKYARNVAGAVANGVPFHVYHFLYCTTEAEAKRDAKLFYDTVTAQGHMPLFWVLDCEKEWGIKSSEARHIAEVFETELRRLAGQDIKVAVYIGHNVYKDYALDYGRYAYVWIPRYGNNDGTIAGSTKPSYPCDLWQYTSTGKIAGISVNVDKNTITGQGKTLEWFLGGME